MYRGPLNFRRAKIGGFWKTKSYLEGLTIDSIQAEAELSFSVCRIDAYTYQEAAKVLMMGPAYLMLGRTKAKRSSD